MDFVTIMKGLTVVGLGVLFLIAVAGVVSLLLPLKQEEERILNEKGIEEHDLH